MTVVRSRPLAAAMSALVAVAIGTGCGSSAKDQRGQTTTPTAAPVLHGEAARAARAVDALGRALRDGDVEHVCHPGAVLTHAVIDDMHRSEMTCEATVEDLLAGQRAPALTVDAVSLEPGLATARVRVDSGPTVPLTLVRDGRRWLVSFSNGTDPLSALIG